MAFVGGVSGTGLGRTGRKICSRSGNRRVLRAKSYDVEIELDGEDHTIPVKSDETFLEAIENFGLTVDSSCRAGVCMTCAAKILAGKVDVGEAALADEVKESGFVLTCSAFPRSEGIKLKMQEFEDAYDMQYGQYEKERQAEESAEKTGFLTGIFGKK
uniref:2Fe-2S ferredoxin-type domain-containing protein n=1 Tax=Rhodosorus marinus TaxID=101924 RepID=A0A7S3EJ51_9RHOD|mmetsp:Transcript_40318/g.160163  ORF Transcript_40318/g.160163 Transcript_40318/m.160163 type:complete len:158 (+) Transcript_40318:196-669(+)